VIAGMEEQVVIDKILARRKEKEAKAPPPPVDTTATSAD